MRQLFNSLFFPLQVSFIIINSYYSPYGTGETMPVSPTHRISLSAEKDQGLQIALEVKNWYIQNWPKGCSEVQWLTIGNHCHTVE
jgi:hypothetical protein